MPFLASKCPRKRASFAVNVEAVLYLSELQRTVASLILASTVLRSGVVNAGLIGSINVTAEAIAFLHWARSSLIISSGSQAALGPAERNRISAAFSTNSLLICIILIAANFTCVREWPGLLALMAQFPRRR